MNAKLEKKPEPRMSTADIGKTIVALLLLAAGVFGFYWFAVWATPLRGLLVAVGFVAALVVFALTAPGRRGLDFFSEARFELRKVVWPTRQESLRTTGVVIVMIMAMSVVLAIIDLVLGWGVGKLLG